MQLLDSQVMAEAIGCKSRWPGVIQHGAEAKGVFAVVVDFECAPSAFTPQMSSRGVLVKVRLPGCKSS